MMKCIVFIISQIDINACWSRPCLNGGTCVDKDDDDFACSCRGGYTGLRCDIDINECEENPCLNDGNCIDGVNSFACNCQDGFRGARCQVRN